MDIFARFSTRGAEIVNGLSPSEMFTMLKVCTRIVLSPHHGHRVELTLLLQLLTGPDAYARGFGNTNHTDKNDEILGKLRKAILDYLNENLELCKKHIKEHGDESKKVLEVLSSIRHVIRGGKLHNNSMPKLAPKASCGYLCRWKGSSSMRPLAYFAYTESRTAVALEPNCLAYNVFDSLREHQTTYPVVTDGEYVYLNHADLSILAWG